MKRESNSLSILQSRINKLDQRVRELEGINKLLLKLLDILNGITGLNGIKRKRRIH